MSETELKLVFACRALMQELKMYCCVHGADEDDEQAIALAEEAIELATATTPTPVARLDGEG